MALRALYRKLHGREFSLNTVYYAINGNSDGEVSRLIRTKLDQFIKRNQNRTHTKEDNDA